MHIILGFEKVTVLRPNPKRAWDILTLVYLLVDFFFVVGTLMENQNLKFYFRIFVIYFMTRDVYCHFSIRDTF